MTYQEIAEQAQQLPIQLRLALIDVITRSLQVDLRSTQPMPSDSLAPPVNRIPPNSALWRIRGIAATNPPLTDADIDLILTDERMEKHA
jgi:hypothetical protein